MRGVVGVKVAAVAVLFLGTACAGGPDPAPAADPSNAPLGSSSPGSAPAPDEVRTSDNVQLVANVPLEAPFNGAEAWGTDLAFQGDYAFVGNYEGFTIHDISDPTRPKVVSRTLCPGGQNDISVAGDLLFLSIDDPREGETCDSGIATESLDAGWEGIRVFDISDKAKPKYVSAVRTDCGSHTHTVLPGTGADKDKLYLYISSPGPIPDSKSCPPPHNKISIVEVPVQDPAKAKVVADPVIFPKGQTADSEGFGLAGCHDVTVYPEKGLAAAACFGDGLLMDVSDPVKPKVLQQVTDSDNFSIWHSATFNNDATKIVFTDELGGGTGATCDRNTPATKGANAIYDIVGTGDDRRLELRSYFKIPREQTSSENCVAHNGSLIPVKGKDIMVQAWYQGGVSIWDFTDAKQPKEIGFFERGPLPAEGGMLGGSWSAYYYNGYIYSSDITKGLDVIEISDPLTDPAKGVKMKEFNVQTQVSY
jgi:hypothetical protein